MNSDKFPAGSAAAARGGARGLGGIGRALSSRQFQLYFVGNVASLLGSWINRMALSWFTWELTGSPAWLGAIAFAAMVPPVVLGPISGTVADRLGSRRTAMAAMLLEAANMLTLIALIATGVITAQLLLAMALLQGVFFSFDLPVRHALVPDLVARSELSAAIAVNTSSFHVTSFVGPVAGGFIIVHWGVAPALAVNAASYILFFFILRAMKLTREGHAANGRHGFLGDLIDGFRYTFGHPAIRVLFLLGICGHVLMRPYYDLLPAFADQVFNRQIDGLTILAAASGLGGLVGGIGLAVRGRMQGLTTAFVWALSGSALFLAAFALTKVFWLAVAILPLVGFGLVIAGIASQSLIQNVVEPSMRARVIGLSVSFATGGPALGALLLGWLGELFSMGPPLATTSLVCALATIMAAPALMRLRTGMEHDGSGAQPLRN